MPSSINTPNKGALFKITDQAIRDEIRKLWELHDLRNGNIGTGEHRFITKAEFDALSKLIATTPEKSQGYRATTLPEEASPLPSTSNGGGGGAGKTIYIDPDPPEVPTNWIAWWNDEEGALKIWYTPPGDPDSSQWVDAMPFRTGPQGASGSSGTSGGTARECSGRLTLTSATPVTTSDVTGASTVYWTPYNGATMALYNGSAWTIYTSAQISLALSGLTAAKNYDVFAYYTGSAIALELSAAWSSDTVRTDALTLVDGVLVKSANNTRRYLGTLRATAATTTEDSAAKRYLFNQYNRVKRLLKGAIETANSWTYSIGGYRQANANAANQLDLVIGDAAVLVEAMVIVHVKNSTSTGRTVTVGIGLDSTTTNSAIALGGETNNAFACQLRCNYSGNPGLGRHYLAWLEYGGGADTQTWFGDGGVPSISQAAIFGSADM